MRIQETKLKGVYVLEQERKEDERGFFARAYDARELKAAGIEIRIAQVNVSFTKQKGMIRGLHAQKPPRQEDKIVICLKGAVYDVAVDIREGSSFGGWVCEELSERNGKMMVIPKGCAHGFQALTDNCELLYIMSEFYSPEHASGFRWNDPAFSIRWPIENPILSAQDNQWPLISYRRL